MPTTAAKQPVAPTAPSTISHLNTLLADATVLWYKLHGYHWNVTGPHFFTLHAHFEALYTEWHGTLDALAERIRAVGGRPLSTLAECLRAATLPEDPSTPAAADMVHNALRDIHALRERAQAAQRTAEAEHDATTQNLLDNLIDAAAKQAWMLSAFLDERPHERPAEPPADHASERPAKR